MPRTLHEWIPLVLTFMGAVAVNAVVLAYGYGQIAQRVEALEKDREIQREEWKAARERAEKVIQRIEDAINAVERSTPK